MRKLLSILLILICFYHSKAQEWSLELSSNVYLRTWQLDTKAKEEEKELGGATIALMQNGKLISQTTSNSNGEFTIKVPQNGEYYLNVSYAGCNTKRMMVNTKNVPLDVQKDNFNPTFHIEGGFIMVKPYPGIDYSELSKDLIVVEYFPSKKLFDDTEAGTAKGLGIVSKIYAAEDVLFKQFCSTNKAGDVALAKPDCPLAKMLYEKAIAMIPGEQYPVVQLAKVGDCLKQKEEADKKAAEENLKKAEAEKLAAEKKAQEKTEKEKAAKEKAEADKLAKEKALKDKTEADKLAAELKTKQKAEKEKEAKEKAEADKLAKEKALKEKTEKEKLALEKKEKVVKEKPVEKEKVNEKKPEEKVVKNKPDAEKNKNKKISEEEKLRKQKEGLAKSKAEDEAAMKADYDKAMAKRKAKEEEDARKKLAYETEHKDHQGEMDKGHSKYSMPQVLGKDMYKENTKKGDDYFKTKRYKEAKASYEAALKIKADDAYVKKKIEECDKQLETK